MKKLWIALSAGAVVIVAIAALVFKPWLLFVDTRVDDPITYPMTVPQDVSDNIDAIPEVPPVVSTGQFISHEHNTSGTATIVHHDSGGYQLILEDLTTSNGPDVHVWLSQGPVIEGSEGWTTAQNYPHIDVAPIKGNLGNHVYDLPADIDPTQWPAVVLWCDDFSVSFGAAELHSPDEDHS